jgi:hypothetical protein
MKTIAFVRAPEGGDPEAYKRWYLEEFAPSLLEGPAKLNGLTVNVVREAEALYEGAGAPPVCDIFAEFWSEQPLAAGDIAPPEGSQQAFCVDEHVEKAELERTPGAVPGIRLFSPLAPVEGATPAESVRYWDEHVPLALRVHVGMNRYVRDIIVAPFNGGIADIFGVASLHFPSDEAIREKFFDSPDSIPVHAADLARFVGAVVPMSSVSHNLL